MKCCAVFLLNILIIGGCGYDATRGSDEASLDALPNIVLVITDDQGYGDLGYHGNHHIQTPHLDALAHESIRFTRFYVSPVCAPTRSSLMTGRYSLRTGVHDTYNGGAQMSTEEITLAEMLKEKEYVTGAFGKWHLGDNYPMRPGDQGFDESVIHLGGGMAQPGDFTTYERFDSAYYDPVLWHNGMQESYEGYCSDIFTDQAIRFIRENRDHPFFCYLAFNAPHTPLQLPEGYYERYATIDPASGFPADVPIPEMSERDKEDARKVYAMVTNIDDNVAKLRNALSELEISDRTLFIFLTDNGPQQRRYNGGLRGRKQDVLEGGVRVPMFISYPEGLEGNRDIDVPAAHLDIFPTLAALTGIDIDHPVDGRSLLPLLRDKKDSLPRRPFFSYWTRRYPEQYHNMSLHYGPYKLVGYTDYDAPLDSFAFYNLINDPYEQNNQVQEEKATARQLKQAMDSIYNDLVNSPNLLEHPRIVLGSEADNPVYLNRNDATGERGVWTQEEVYAKWLTRITAGTYDITVRFVKPVAPGGIVLVQSGTRIYRHQITGDTTQQITLPQVPLPSGDQDFLVQYFKGGKKIFPLWVSAEKRD